MTITEFQRSIEKTYLERDARRGVGGTFMWFTEEVGELASALQKGATKAEMEGEFADVFAWLCSLASIAGIEMSQAVRKYADGCPACHHSPCGCSEK